MKIFKALVILLSFYVGQSVALTPQEYLETCKNMPLDRHSACYSYFQGVVDTMQIYKNKPCFNKSDKEIYIIAINSVAKFVKKYPNVTLYFPADIMREAFYKEFPANCTNKVGRSPHAKKEKLQA